MSRHLEALRFLLTELLMHTAVKVVPKHTREARELAVFIMHSWIGENVAKYQEQRENERARFQLQQDWKRKVEGK